jgi:hypothetical protein
VPFVEVDGVRQPFTDVGWSREQSWLPRMTARCGGGEVELSYCAPVGERGVVCRLVFRRGGGRSSDVVVGWRVRWLETALVQLRSKPLDVDLRFDSDPWTGSHLVHATAGLPLLALGFQAGSGTEVVFEDLTYVVSTTPEGRSASELTAELFVAIAPERDGAATTALHLRRRGFDDLWGGTVAWLGAHELPVEAMDAREGLHRRVNENAFFNFFFSQGDCLDTGRPTIVTSRSSDYYVSAAFWSRDAYQWTFPALLLTDPVRARETLVSSLESAGPRVADHALYLNGTSLYPGFELDQAAAPVLALHLYVTSTGDTGVLEEPAVRRLCDGFVAMIAPWRNAALGLYATFLLPTDDPTRHPYTTTDNALVRAALDALGHLAAMRDADTPDAAGLATLSTELGQAIIDRLVTQGPHGAMWAWGCDEHGSHIVKDEPPLSLASLPFWGLCDPHDPHQRATEHWLDADNPYRYEGAFPGTGSPHFPYPSGFDLASRLLMPHRDGDPLAELVATPMDHGLGCESWDPGSGVVTTGAAMASMAGLLTWTAWSRIIGRTLWHQPISLPARGSDV